MERKETLRPIMHAIFPWKAYENLSRRRYDFTEVDDQAIKEFHRQAELALEGTVKLAIAADSRATTSTSILSAATAGSLVVSANLAGAEHPHAVLIGSIVSASFCLLLAAAYCALASRPIDFYVTGYEPDLLFPAAVSDNHIRRVSTADIQMRIDANRVALKSAAETLRRGQALAALAPVVFLLTFCLFSR